MMNPTVLPGASSGTGPGAPAYDDAELRGRVVEAEDDIAGLKTDKASTDAVTAVRDRVTALDDPGTRFVLEAIAPLSVTSNPNGGYISFNVAFLPVEQNGYGRFAFVSLLEGLTDADDLAERIVQAFGSLADVATVEFVDGRIRVTAVDPGVPMDVTAFVGSNGAPLVVEGLPNGSAVGTLPGKIATLDNRATRYFVDRRPSAAILLPRGRDPNIVTLGELGIGLGDAVDLSTSVGGVVRDLATFQVSNPGATLFQFVFDAFANLGDDVDVSVSSNLDGRFVIRLECRLGSDVDGFQIVGAPIQRMTGGALPHRRAAESRLPRLSTRSARSATSARCATR